MSRAALFLLSVAVVIVPWTLRTFEVYGRFAPVGAMLGQNAFLGLNGLYLNPDYFLEESQQITQANATVHRYLTAPPAPPWDRSTKLNILDRSAENVRRGLAYSWQNPGYTARTRIKKLADWVTPLSFFVRHYRLDRYKGILAGPIVQTPLIATALVLPMLVLGGAVGGVCFCLKESAGRCLFGWTLLYFTLASSLIVAMSRYRICVEPLLIVLAAAFLSGAGGWRWRSKAAVACVTGWTVLAGLWLMNVAEVWAMVRPLVMVK